MHDTGELYTWGKGRYGRLGHGDSEDQLRPKLVESLLGYRVIDVACGEFSKMKTKIPLNLTVWILATTAHQSFTKAGWYCSSRHGILTDALCSDVTNPIIICGRYRYLPNQSRQHTRCRLLRSFSRCRKGVQKYTTQDTMKS